MAGAGTAGTAGNSFHLRFFFLANRHTCRTSRMKTAAGWRIQRGRNISLKNDPLFPIGMKSGDC